MFHVSWSISFHKILSFNFQMSKIVNNPADRKAIIWDQSHLNKFQMFIPLALFCFFYFLVLSCIKVQKTYFSHLPCFAVLKERQGRFMMPLPPTLLTKNNLGRSRFLLKGISGEVLSVLCLQVNAYVVH